MRFEAPSEKLLCLQTTVHMTNRQSAQRDEVRDQLFLISPYLPASLEE